MRARSVWLAIGGIVVGHNITAEDGDTLSECVDEWLERHRWITLGGITILALHLANVVPERYDPIHALFIGARWVYPMRRLAPD